MSPADIEAALSTGSPPPPVVQEALARAQLDEGVLFHAFVYWLKPGVPPAVQFYAAAVVYRQACTSRVNAQDALAVMQRCTTAPKPVTAKLCQAVAAAAVRSDGEALDAAMSILPVSLEIPSAVSAACESATAVSAAEIRAAVSSRIPHLLAQAQSASPIDTAKLLSAWSPFSAQFATAAIVLVPKVASLAASDSSNAEEAVDALLAWLSADKTTPPETLLSLMDAFAPMCAHAHALHNNGDPEGGASAARVLRLYGELVAPVLTPAHDGLLHAMAALSAARVADGSDAALFWVAVIDANARMDVVSHVLSAVLPSTPRSSWPSSAPVVASALKHSPRAVWEILVALVRGDGSLRAAAFAVASIPAAVDASSTSDPLTAEACTALVPLVAAGPRTSDACRAIAALAPFLPVSSALEAAHFLLGSDIAANPSTSSNGSTNVQAHVAEAYAILAKHHGETLASLTLAHAQSLGKAAWPAVCAAALSTGHADGLADRILDRTGGPPFLCVDGAALLRALIDSSKSTNDILAHASLAECLRIAFSSPLPHIDDPRRADILAVWETAVAKTANTHCPSVLALASPVLTHACTATEPALIPVLDAAVIAAPNDVARPAFLALVSACLPQGNVDEDRFVTAAPVLERVLALAQRSASPDAALAALQPAQSRLVAAILSALAGPSDTTNGVSDDFMRAAVRVASRSPLPDDDSSFHALVAAVAARLTVAQVDIVGPLVLRMLLQRTPQRAAIVRDFAVRAGIPPSAVDVHMRSLVACRLPRRFTSLLLALFRPGCDALPSN